MLSAERNEMLTRIGPGSPAAAVLRSYWLPIAVSAQLEQRNPMPVTPFGEKLALFRDKSGKLGLVAVFPSAVRLGLPIMDPGMMLVFWAVPVSETETWSFHSWFVPLPEGAPDEVKAQKLARMKQFIYELDDTDPVHHQSKVNVQDKFACYSQGAIADRTDEHLGKTDAGINLLRRLYFAAIEDVRAGKDPIGLVREPAEQIVRFDNVF